MWPLEPSSREYLRICRDGVERWTGRSAPLEFVAHCAVPARAYVLAAAGQRADLETSLRGLYAEAPRSAVTLLVETALMPALLIEAGAELWSPSQMRTLLRHRLNHLYAKPNSPVEAWDTRIDFVAGESHGLGFGMRTSLRHALVHSCASVGIECRALLPALAWGLHRLRSSRQLTARGTWLCWAEQDRRLLARIEAGRVRTLNAAAGLARDSSGVAKQIKIEQSRWGLASTTGVILATDWNSNAAPAAARKGTSGDGVSWVDIGCVAAAHGEAGRAIAQKWVAQS